MNTTKDTLEMMEDFEAAADEFRKVLRDQSSVDAPEIDRDEPCEDFEALKKKHPFLAGI